MEATWNAHSVHLLLLPTIHARSKLGNTTAAGASSQSRSEMNEKIQISVCTNRTCRKQGSLDALLVFSGIAPPYVTVKSCGCLGKCGSGPNVVILPEGVFVGHCGTPSKVASVMSIVCGYGDGGEEAVRKCLEALALRKKAEEEIHRGDFAQACSFLSQAIELKPFGGVHIVYKDRSAARLATGDINGALEDAKEALSLAPHYAEAYVCEGDVFMAMDKFDAAEESYSIALDLEPSIRRAKSFKAKLDKLREKLAPSKLG